MLTRFRVVSHRVDGRVIEIDGDVIATGKLSGQSDRIKIGMDVHLGHQDTLMRQRNEQDAQVKKHLPDAGSIHFEVIFQSTDGHCPRPTDCKIAFVPDEGIRGRSLWRMSMLSTPSLRRS